MRDELSRMTSLARQRGLACAQRRLQQHPAAFRVRHSRWPAEAAPHSPPDRLWNRFCFPRPRCAYASRRQREKPQGSWIAAFPMAGSGAQLSQGSLWPCHSSSLFPLPVLKRFCLWLSLLCPQHLFIILFHLSLPTVSISSSARLPGWAALPVKSKNMAVHLNAAAGGFLRGVSVNAGAQKQ